MRCCTTLLAGSDERELPGLPALPSSNVVHLAIVRDSALIIRPRRHPRRNVTGTRHESRLGSTTVCPDSVAGTYYIVVRPVPAR